MGSSCSQSCSTRCGKESLTKDELLTRPTQRDIDGFIEHVSSEDFIEFMIKMKSDKDPLKAAFYGLNWDYEQLNQGSTKIAKDIENMSAGQTETKEFMNNLRKYKPNFPIESSEAGIGVCREYFLLYLEGYVIAKTLQLGKARWWRKYKKHTKSTLQEELEMFQKLLMQSYNQMRDFLPQEDFEEKVLGQTVADQYLDQLYGGLQSPQSTSGLNNMAQEYLENLYKWACKQQ